MTGTMRMRARDVTSRGSMGDGIRRIKIHSKKENPTKEAKK